MSFARNDDMPEGRVFEQSPDRDGYVDPGSTVSFTVSTGVTPVALQNVVGQPKDEAKATLEGLGFVVELQEVESDDPKGRVVETDPAYPTTLPKGSTVTVSFSDGPEKIPDVVDLSQADAEQAIRDAGFVPDVIMDANSTKPAGTVFRQSPAAGEPAAEGTTVTIVVSSLDESPTEVRRESDGESDDRYVAQRSA